MKHIEEMTGVEKAAALLVAVGQKTASEIMKHLDDTAVLKISAEIAKINRLSPEEKEDLIGEFMIQIKKMKRSGFQETSGEDFAKKILIDSFGDEKAAAILAKLTQIPVKEQFDFIGEINESTVVGLIAGEHPQIIAVMLAHIGSIKAGAIMKLLPRDTAKEVALRLARMGQVSPEAVNQAAVSLRKKYELMADKVKSDSPGGTDTLAGILNHLGADAESRIMASIDDEMPEFAHEIRKKLYVFEFETIALLTNREIRIILQKIPENRIIAKALKGTDDDLKYRILKNMSTNRAADIVSLIDLMGAVRMSEVTEARTMIVTIMRELDDKGIILIRKGGDDLVE